ncbi:DUF1189 domain-containing protein [Bacillus sp. 2205SS5-2]|uniref:DUF1189 domain-containing protein n=1 Tax=Bacillus sp. 2205SS5-2 TaxID=3109031 RepID=UPI003006D413
MNIFSQLFKSLYSPKDIAKVRFQGIGKTLLFVFFLSLLASIPIIISLTTLVNKTIDEGSAILEGDIPSFEIVNGSLKTDQTAPFSIVEDHFTFHIDPSSDSLNSVDQNSFIVGLVKNKMIIATEGNQQEIPYNQLSELEITNDSVLTYIDMFQSSLIIFLPIIYIIIYLFSSFITFIKVLLFAVIGLFIAKMLKRKLSYRQSFRLTAYANSLPIIFFLIMDLLKTTIPAGLLLNWLIITVMLYLTINEIPQSRSTKRYDSNP